MEFDLKKPLAQKSLCMETSGELENGFDVWERKSAQEY